MDGKSDSMLLHEGMIHLFFLSLSLSLRKCQLRNVRKRNEVSLEMQRKVYKHVHLVRPEKSPAGNWCVCVPDPERSELSEEHLAGDVGGAARVALPYSETL